MQKTFADYQIEIPAGRSGELDLTCPRCSHTRKKKHVKCLSVNVDRGLFYCIHCNWGGNLGIGEYRNESTWRQPTYIKPTPREPGPLDLILPWFARRGIQPEIVERNKIFSAKVYMPQVESFRSVISFPYFRNGELINVKYRDAEKNFRMEAQAERILYGYDSIQDDGCVIVEGELDRLALETANVPSCVSVPDGAPAPESKNYASKFTFLDDERLERVQKWIIAVDSDPPGVRLEQELVRRLGIEKCLKVTWPDGLKDANEVLLAHSPEFVRNLIETAKPYPIEGVIEVNDLTAQLDALYQQGVLRGLTTGWHSLDPLYTVRPGEWTVVTGIPSSGKSNWVDALMVNLARCHEWQFAVFSPENQPLHNHVSRILEHYARVPFRDGPTPRMSLDDMHKAREWAHMHFRFILPPDDALWTVDNVFSTSLSLIRRHGINGIVIDPWNEMEHSRPSTVTETEYISVTLKKIRQFARRNGIHIWLVAHPTKLYRMKNGDYPIPSLYDISGSGHWYNKSDNGVVVWRDLNNPDSPSVKILIKKIRFREVGQIGDVELRYDRATGGYSDISPMSAITANIGHISATDEDILPSWNQYDD